MCWRVLGYRGKRRGKGGKGVVWASSMRVLRADLCRFIECVCVFESVKVQGKEKREKED